MRVFRIYKKMRFICLMMFIFIAFTGCKKNPSLDKRSQALINIPKILQTIPEEDYQVLDSFFQLLVRDYDFAYTLFGKKPMSMACYSPSITSFTLYHPNEYLIFEKGWELWNRYSPDFPSDDFVIKQSGFYERKIVGVFLINKKSALETLLNNWDTFKEFLGSDIEPEQLLKEICHPEKSIEKTLKDHSGLLGILLGYGKINAITFERKARICNYFNTKMTPPFSAQHELDLLDSAGRNIVNLYAKGVYLPPAKISPHSLKFTSLPEELNHILAHEEPFEIEGTDFFLDKIAAPVFMATKAEPETESLRTEYKATKRTLAQAYLKGSFLEVTLNQWMSPQ